MTDADLKWRVLGNTRGFGLAIGTPVTFPTGGEDRFRGDSGFTFAPRLILDYVWERVTLAAHLGYFFRERVDFGDLRFDDEISYGLGVGVSLWRQPWGLGWRDRLVAIAEVYGRTEVLGSPLARCGRARRCAPAPIRGGPRGPWSRAGSAARSRPARSGSPGRGRRRRP